MTLNQFLHVELKDIALDLGRDLGPVSSAGLTLVHYVVADGGTTVLQRRLPGYLDTGGENFNIFGTGRRARHI